MKPGIYDLAADKYHADLLGDTPTLNASVCKLLISRSPLHAWTEHPKLNPNYREKVATKFDVGTVVHALSLQGELITQGEITFRVADEAVRRATLVKVDSKPFALVTGADDWRTRIAKDVREEARRRGLVPFLAEQWEQARDVVAAIRVQLPKLDCQPGMFVDGRAERTLVWQDHGVWCRARMDWLHDDHRYVDDLKSTAASASPLVWASRTLFSIHAEIQAVMTIRGIRAVTGRTPEFRFLACETRPPYAISPVRLGPSAIAMANHEIDRALEQWKRCLETDTWPAYPRVIVDAEPPSWRESEMWAAESIAEEVAA